MNVPSVEAIKFSNDVAAYRLVVLDDDGNRMEFDAKINVEIFAAIFCGLAEVPEI